MKRRKHQKFRSRGGIRLPAAITLCLALSLLIFSRAGGEPIAQKRTSRPLLLSLSPARRARARRSCGMRRPARCRAPS